MFSQTTETVVCLTRLYKLLCKLFVAEEGVVTKWDQQTSNQCGYTVSLHFWQKHNCTTQFQTKTPHCTLTNRSHRPVIYNFYFWRNRESTQNGLILCYVTLCYVFNILHFKATTYQIRYQEYSLQMLFFLEKYSEEAGICENFINQTW